MVGWGCVLGGVGAARGLAYGWWACVCLSPWLRAAVYNSALLWWPWREAVRIVMSLCWQECTYALAAWVPAAGVWGMWGVGTTRGCFQGAAGLLCACQWYCQQVRRELVTGACGRALTGTYLSQVAVDRQHLLLSCWPHIVHHEHWI